MAPPQPSLPVRPPRSTMISPGVGSLADHVLSRSRAHDSADLHTLCHIARMIDLIYQSGGQTDLVAVGAVALRRAHSKLFSAEAYPLRSLPAVRSGPRSRSHAWPDIHRNDRTADRGWAPPRQVAAPPNGSISVGWLCVSFLKLMRPLFCLGPSNSTGTTMEQALISSLSSMLSRMPSLSASSCRGPPDP